MFVGGDDASGMGVGDPILIRVEDNPSGLPSVGVIESYARGAGEMVRSSAWIAAVVATQANHQFVNDYEFYVRGRFPYMDGPSAGMLTTVGFLAAIRGDAILPDTAMTGTINPDGTAGPVGAIPGKMRGAKEKGVKRFAFPTGSRIVRDGLTGRSVDLLVLGRELGFTEVREVATLEDAYHFMTGVLLETPAPASEAEMALPFEMQRHLQSRARSLNAQLQSRVPAISLKLERADRQVKERVGPYIDALNSTLESASQHEKNGWFAAAYWENNLAELYLQIIDKQIDFLVPLYRGDWPAVRAQIEAAHRAYETIQTVEEEAELLSRRSTLGGILNSIQSMGHYAQARVRDFIGHSHFHRYLEIEKLMQDDKISREEKQKISEAAREHLILALLNYAIAQVRIDFSREIANFAAEEGPAAVADMGALANYGRAYGAAASAGLATINSVILQPVAEQLGLSLDVAQDIFSRTEFDYPFILNSFTMGLSPRRQFQEPYSQALYQIGLGYQGYLQAAGLVNKYYSLEAAFDESGAVDIRNRPLLTIQLDLARRRAREASARCRDELGFIPSFCRFYYELGVASREGDELQRMQALVYFWESRQIAELALLLGGK